jgi:hypothetical protein
MNEPTNINFGIKTRFMMSVCDITFYLLSIFYFIFRLLFTIVFLPVMICSQKYFNHFRFKSMDEIIQPKM